MQNTNTPTEQALRWFRASLDGVRADRPRWIGMAILYLAMALLLREIIPFAIIYNFLLALITPALLAGALIAARTAPIPLAGATLPQTWIVRPFNELLQGVKRQEYLFTTVISCIVTLGLMVLIYVPALLITGGTVVAGFLTADIGVTIQWTTVLGILVVALLYLALGMALLYLMPLGLFGKRAPISAVAESFRTCWRQRRTLAAFIAPFVIINVLISIGFNTESWIGYLLLVVVGPIALPVFVLGLHQSYGTLFETPAPVVPPPLVASPNTLT